MTAGAAGWFANSRHPIRRPDQGVTMRGLRVAATTLLIGCIALAAVFTVGPFAVVTTNGISMQPRISAGDLVVVGPASSYGIGDSVAYRSAELDTVVLHRIVAVEGDRFVFQGDNNSWLDPEKPTVDDFVGKELLHIPQGGTWLKRLTSPPALAAYAFLLLAGGTAAARTKRQRRQERRTVSPRHSTGPSRSTGGLPPSLRPVAATAAAAGVLGVALAGLSWTRPATTTGAELSSVDSTLDFSYTATVPASAAYDGTTVTAPQPVFRALTDSVDVSYDYAGRPGKIAVDAELSTQSGWRSTVHLSPAQPLTAQQQGTVRLDLSTLEDRAEAAAAVTGIPADSLTITVIPRIWMDGGGQFAPELPLTLDALTLKPGSEEVLTATTSSQQPGTGVAPAQLSALGRSVDVATARQTSLAAALLAGVLGLALLALARMHGPVADADRVRARHKNLLLPVLPVALTPGRPVVDVPDIDALATLADRYGLLILHWQRSGVTTYVVQDEGTTYRFRSWAAQQPHEELELEPVEA
jgi:signal peptidase I